jgi:hypothetical protein
MSKPLEECCVEEGAAGALCIDRYLLLCELPNIRFLGEKGWQQVHYAAKDEEQEDAQGQG